MLNIILTAGLIVTTMNAFNFIDGLDGLAAGVAIIGGAAFFLTAYWVHRNAPLTDFSDLATLLTAVLVGSCVGFLPHNWFPSKIFMGDSGAMLIGLLMASAGVVSTGQITSGLYDRANGIPTIIPILLPFAVLFLPLWTSAWPSFGAPPWAARHGQPTVGTCTTNCWTSGIPTPGRRGADVPVDLRPGLRRTRVRGLPLADRPGRGPCRGGDHGCGIRHGRISGSEARGRLSASRRPARRNSPRCCAQQPYDTLYRIISISCRIQGRHFAATSLPSNHPSTIGIS